MAEGKQQAPQGTEEEAPAGAMAPAPVTETQEAQPVVRPKSTQAMAPVGEAQEATAAGGTGEWWQSPALANVATGRGRAPKPRPSLMNWRERRVIGDEEEEWSYSTAPGQYTMDVLRDRFGEAGYQGLSSWQRLDGSSGHSDPTRFQLSSPRLHLPPAVSVPVVGDPGLGVPPSQSQPGASGGMLGAHPRDRPQAHRGPALGLRA